MALISRPDVVLAVHRCACWQNEPSAKLKRWVLRIVAYLKGTKHLGLGIRTEQVQQERAAYGHERRQLRGRETEPLAIRDLVLLCWRISALGVIENNARGIVDN